jgi:hypothetical protein
MRFFILLSKMFILLVLSLIAWYWSYSQKLKRLALDASIRCCQQANVQFLDDSVVMHQIKLSKNARNQRFFLREYRFEFTSTGEQRYSGRVFFQDEHLTHSELEPYSIN